MAETLPEMCHRLAGHPGAWATCEKCQAVNPARPEVQRRTRAAARRRSAAVKDAELKARRRQADRYFSTLTPKR